MRGIGSKLLILAVLPLLLGYGYSLTRVPCAQVMPECACGAECACTFLHVAYQPGDAAPLPITDPDLSPAIVPVPLELENFALTFYVPEMPPVDFLPDASPPLALRC